MPAGLACCCQQRGARLVLVECEAGDEQRWRAQLEARGAQSAGSQQAHKPLTWQHLQQLLARYAGCWRWSTDGSVHVAHRLVVDTTAADLGSNVAAVLDFLEQLRQQATPQASQLQAAGG